MDAATDTPKGRITGSNWRAIPYALLTDPRRMKLSMAAFGVYVAALLAGQRDTQKGKRPEWDSREHLCYAAGIPSDDADAVAEAIAGGFLEQFEDGGLSIPARDWDQWTNVRPDPTSTERKRRERERKRTEQPTQAGPLSMREQLGHLAKSEPSEQAMRQLDGMNPDEVMDSARARSRALDGDVSGDGLVNFVLRGMR